VTLAATGRDVSGAEQSAASTHVPGEAGLWVFIFADLMLFSIYFVIFLANRIHDPEPFAASRSAMHQGLGGLNTIVLLTSSLLVAIGVRAVQRGYRSRPAWLFLGGAACAAVFCFVKIVEYRDLAHHGYSIFSNTFFQYYFVLTGLHLAHVIAGGVVLAVIFWLVRRQPTLSTRQLIFVEGGSSWWHVVDILWLVLFSLLYLAW
jgi:nitric oxide reductase NorE protein